MFDMDIHHLNVVDYGIIAVMFIAILVGLVLGFVRMTMIVITWCAALTLGMLYYEKISTWFTAISVQGARYFLAFVLIVLATLIVGGIISYLIGQIVRATKFSVMDRMIGLVFGFAVGAIIVASVILVSSSSFIAQESLWKTSQLIPQFNPLSSWIKTLLPGDLMDKIFSPSHKIQAKELVKEAEGITQKGISEGANAIQNVLDENLKKSHSSNDPQSNQGQSNPNPTQNQAQHSQHPQQQHKSSNNVNKNAVNLQNDVPNSSNHTPATTHQPEGYQTIQIDVSPEAIPRDSIQKP